MGTKQNTGLKAKLRSRTDTFLVKMRTMIRIEGSEAKIPPSSSMAVISSEKTLVELIGVTKPTIIEMVNTVTVIKIHLL
jgi:hypothetical protein